MAKKPTGAAFGAARALDAVRARRGSGAAASGNVTGKGLKVNAGGQHSLFAGSLFYFDSQGRLQFRDPGAPLSIQPGSPERIVLNLASGLTVDAKGKLAPRISTSVKVNANGQLVATPSTAEVTDPTDGTAAAALGRIANELAALDARIDVLELPPTLVPSGANRFLKAGTTNYTAYYCAGLANGVALTTKALVANRIFAVPYVAPDRGGTLDELEVYVTTGVAATNLRIGIYENASESGLYPGTLLLDAGEFTSTTSSQKRTASISQALTPGALYWFVVVSDGAPTIRGGSTNQAGHLLGTASSANTTYTTHLYAAQTYGALPSTFPGSPTAGTGSFPAVFFRMSA